ncbi:type II toxin-antitoxin system YafQ family toxin, partial [Haliea salexigens]|uniref:type II toxin-antitoxin system YafQ family toxin n=1 Tax=Haliea salexigens TaxID=287487 RepID=UPI00196A0CEC
AGFAWNQWQAWSGIRTYLDHPLRGDWKGYRDAHIEPDWLLLYRIEGDELHLARTGTHADLFRQ